MTQEDANFKFTCMFLLTYFYCDCLFLYVVKLCDCVAKLILLLWIVRKGDIYFNTNCFVVKRKFYAV